MTRRAYVVGAYIPNGGTFMAYHLGKILQEDFGFTAVAVRSAFEAPGGSENGIFDYDPVFPSVCEDEMVASITDQDVLIANPSFSPHAFGFRCRGRKVMYIQGFTTFNLLDCRFDHYVTVSNFVRRFIAVTYGIETTVVPPFIRADTFPPRRAWAERPAGSILVLPKGRHQQLMLDRLRKMLPDVVFDTVDAQIPQFQLMAQIAQYRHVLTLSEAEGFGLLPLEAMAMGATVVGFDAFGGRDYLRPGINCAVTTYPDIEGVAKLITTVLADAVLAQALAEAGHATAADPLYTYEHFRAAWRAQFAIALAK